jgi:hypothetical protein
MTDADTEKILEKLLIERAFGPGLGPKQRAKPPRPRRGDKSGRT